MNDPSAVNVAERAANLHGMFDETIQVAGTFSVHLLQGASVDTLHRDEKIIGSVSCLEVVDTGDVRMIERRHDTELGAEKAEACLVLTDPCHDLQRDGAIGKQGVMNVIDPAHAAVA